MGCAHSALHRFSNVTVTFNSNTWTLTDAALTVASIFDCRLCGLCKLEALSRDTVDGFHHLALLVISVFATPYYNRTVHHVSVVSALRAGFKHAKVLTKRPFDNDKKMKL